VIAALDRDPAVPQRDLLLDVPFVAERLGRLLGPNGPLRIDDCRPVRVKYRVGARLRTVHRIRVGSVTLDVAATTFPALERSERAYAQARVRAVPTGPARAVAHDRELATVFWTFPNDRKIADLPALAEPAPELVELLPVWARSALVSYAPEKAATVRCFDSAGRTVAYAKTYAGREGERAARVHDTLNRALTVEDRELRLPRSLGYSLGHRTLVIEAIEGSPLHARTAPDLRVRYRRLGRALARMHGLEPPDGTRFRRADADRIDAAAELIGSVRGDVGFQVRRLARELAGRIDTGNDVVCLHGDVNFRNALVENGRVALIDLDQVAAGPAAAELGSVLASLRYAGVVGMLHPSAVPALIRAFVSGYAALRAAPDEATLRAHTAAALLVERCLRVVTRVRPTGLRRLPALLTAAQEELG
jgi:aminoglycoside phosphotransferase